MRQHIFYNLIQNSEGQLAERSIYSYNCILFEIAANWSWIRWMMHKYKKNELREVDKFERGWLNFILQNNINIERYEKDSDKFLDEYFKKIN